MRVDVDGKPVSSGVLVLVVLFAASLVSSPVRAADGATCINDIRQVAMNEPAQSLRPQTHVAQLTEATLLHPMLAESKEKPPFGLTLGMTEILASREILLLVSGANKRNPLQKLLQSEVTTEFPASLLWLHANWTLLCDQSAGLRI